jgi:hypothetical protein
MKVPKNKREGIDTCGQSISDRNAWNAPPNSLQILLDSTSKISTARAKMPPSAHPPADLHGKSMETAANTAQKGGQPKGQPKPSCKEETEQLAKLVGSSAWAKKKKKADQKRARKTRRRLQGPLYPYSIRVNGIEKDSSLTITKWHGINADLVPWIAGEIIAASYDVDFTGLNIEEYKFVEHPEKGGVKTAQRTDNERKSYGLLLFKNLQSKNMGERAVKACGLPDASQKTGRSALTHTSVETDQMAVYTTSVNKYFWSGTVQGIWAVAQKVLKGKLPKGIPGIELEKSLSTNRDKDLSILVYRANTAWETAIDLLKGELTIMIGTLKLKKRRDGEGAAHKVRSRERAAAAATKAAEKAAEEASATAEAVDYNESDDKTAMQ